VTNWADLAGVKLRLQNISISIFRIVSCLT